jgi:peptidoglycan/LPS O-acetylase OafA/YrhL
MKRKRKHLLIGIALIVISIFVVYFNMQFLEGSFKTLWPAILLLFGMFLYLYYFSTKKKKNRLAALFIATFIAVSSVPLFVLTVTSFSHFRVLWPGFVFALGIALLALYFYGRGKKGALFGAAILLSISVLIWIVFSLKSQFGLVIGVSLFIVGAAFLTRGLIKEEKEQESVPLPESPESPPAKVSEEDESVEE